MRDQLLAEYGGEVLVAAEALARGLMAGDPDSFKAGYSAESAALAAVEMFALDDAQAAELRRRLPDR